MTITVAGIGYGADTTAAVAEALAEADVVIGHEVFLTAVTALVRPGAECFDVLDRATPGEDVFAVRTRVAAERSAEGAKVVVVSGGDPGLLGMAGPVFHNLDATGRRAEIPGVRVLPGLSAWQYASAALGAPFNGGVSVISLCLYSHSEETVRRQVSGVAASGLGTVVYMVRHNGEEHPELFPTEVPATELARGRFTLLRDEFLRHRPADTPVHMLTGLGDPAGHTCATAPLERALELWEDSGTASVFCVPAAASEEAAGRLWAST